MTRIYQEKEESAGQEAREPARLLLGEYDGRWWYDRERRQWRKTRRHPRRDRRMTIPTFEDYLATINPRASIRALVDQLLDL